jgi:hypothetical protein
VQARKEWSVSNEKACVGEVAIAVAILADTEPEQDFAAYEHLPNRALVAKLARAFSDGLELMPYQELGDKTRLAVNVYLRPRSGDGRIIAVLSREYYPPDLRALRHAVERARKRLERLNCDMGSQFDEASLVSAHETLEHLAESIAQA